MIRNQLMNRLTYIPYCVYKGEKMMRRTEENGNEKKQNRRETREDKNKKVRSNQFLIGIVLIVVLLTMTSCQHTKMNQIGDKYSEAKIEKMVSDYLEEKYEMSDVSIENISKFEDAYSGIDATSFYGFAGFAVKTTDCMVYIKFDSDENYTIADDKQWTEIESDMKKRLHDTYQGTAYLTMAYEKVSRSGYQEKELPYLSQAQNAYTAYYDGDLHKLFEEEIKISKERMHIVNIYVEAIKSTSQEENSTKQLDPIIEAFAKLHKYVYITKLEPERYDELKDSFDDYEKMAEIDEMSEKVEE